MAISLQPLLITDDIIVSTDFDTFVVDINKNILIELPDMNSYADGVYFRFRRKDNSILHVATISPINSTIEGQSSATLSVLSDFGLFYFNGEWLYI